MCVKKFEERVTHHYDFLGDRLHSGKFCAIVWGIEFVMNGANQKMCGSWRKSEILRIYRHDGIYSSSF